jgi:hypothetical protein
VVTFSEAIAKGTGNIVLKTAAGATVAIFDAASSANLSISGNTLTLNPGADLGYSTSYKVEFAAGSVKDLAGNSYAGTTSYNFSTTSALNESEVQKLYIAYFNRPGDTGGLGFWEGLLANDVSMTALQNSFSSSPEYQAIYIGQQNAVLITKLYQNLFGRVVDVNDGGVRWWAGEMVAGRHTITTIAGALSSGTTPGSADNIAIINKIAAATAFTNALDTTAETENYAGAASFAITGNWLATVRDDGTLAAALASRDATIAAAVAAKTVLVSATGSYDASSAEVTFQFAAASFDYTISGLGVGDRIDLPTGGTTTLSNASNSDGQVDLTWSGGANEVVIHLVGLSVGQDGQLNSVADFNTVFGAGSVC